MMSTLHRYRGACTCGAVQFWAQFTEKPNFALFCHCDDCRNIHSAPFAAYVGLPADSGIQMIQGEDKLRQFCIERSTRNFCEECGTLVFSRVEIKLTGTRFIAAEWSLLQDRDALIEPSLHIRYAQRIMDIRDGKPKYSGPPGSPMVQDDGSPVH